jgi:hypothetical protein
LDDTAVRYFSIFPVLGLCILIVCSTYAKAQSPFYAAYVSDELTDSCKNLSKSKCVLNIYDSETLGLLITELPASLMIVDSLGLSEYEVLIASALIRADEKTQQAELVLEITTNWRQVPIDDFNVRKVVSMNNTDEIAKEILSEWAHHIETQSILEATQIYQVLGASNYAKELLVPSTIGDFVRSRSAIYRDPLLGSITRYSHPQFSTAVVDIAVYPLSPFLETRPSQARGLARNSLQLVMENEISQIKGLFAQANIEDYTISSIRPARINAHGSAIEGLCLEILLDTEGEPTYSTQYVFQQKDKIIKLSGNLPDFMMRELVNESLPNINVPSESSFMQSMRQG